MQAFKLVKEHTNKYNNLVGKKIGDGADGDVYSYKEDKNKVIKFSVYYLYEDEDPKEVIYNKLEGFSKVQSESELFAKLYEYSYIGEGERDTVKGKQKYLLFSYIMEKCFKISEDEKKVFHSLISHEDNNIVKQYSIEKIQEILNGLKLGLEFSNKKVIQFVQKIKNSKVKYTDVHPRNIMKDSKGEYKFIDFDRIDV